MKKGMRLSQLMGFALTSLTGTLLHFLYEASGGSLLTAPFSGVNESTWEHMKLLFWPLLIYAIAQSLFLRTGRCFWSVKLKGTLLGLSLIPTLFYTYNGAFGTSPSFINIGIFFVAAGAAYLYEARRLGGDNERCLAPPCAFALLLALGALFVAFTFAPPALPLFRDPLSGGYGIAASPSRGLIAPL